MSFHETWAQGIVSIFGCDRATAEGIIADQSAEQFLSFAATPSQVLSLFTYPVHTDCDEPEDNLSVCAIADNSVAAPHDHSPKFPDRTIRINYLKAILNNLNSPPSDQNDQK